jgi:hypothetical protein
VSDLWLPDSDAQVGADLSPCRPVPVNLDAEARRTRMLLEFAILKVDIRDETVPLEDVRRRARLFRQAWRWDVWPMLLKGSGRTPTAANRSAPR